MAKQATPNPKAKNPKAKNPKAKNPKAKSAPVKASARPQTGPRAARGAAIRSSDRAGAMEDKSSGPRSRRGERTRERLLEAAKEVFERDGFLNARISDIAAQAEQSHGSFYYYFDSKEQIFREVAAAVDASLFSSLDDVILAESVLTPHERIREGTRRFLDSYRREAKMLHLIEQVSHYDPEVSAMRITRQKRFDGRVADSVRLLQDRGAADPDLDPMIVAAALGALTYRFAELWLGQQAIECGFEHAVEQLCRIYENAIGGSLKSPIDGRAGKTKSKGRRTRG